MALAASSSLRWLTIALLLVGAVLCLVLPFASATFFSIALGGVAIVAGITQLLRIGGEIQTRGKVFRGLSGALYLLGGLALYLYPVQGVVSLTLYVGVLMVFEGVMELAAAAAGALPARGMVLLDGLVTTLLGGLLIAEWPADSLWAIGTLLGIALLFSAVNLLTTPTAPAEG